MAGSSICKGTTVDTSETVIVFWDIETCPVGEGIDPVAVAASIVDWSTTFGSIIQIKVIGAFSLGPIVAQQFHSLGISIDASKSKEAGLSRTIAFHSAYQFLNESVFAALIVISADIYLSTTIVREGTKKGVMTVWVSTDAQNSHVNAHYSFKWTDWQVSSTPGVENSQPEQEVCQEQYYTQSRSKANIIETSSLFMAFLIAKYGCSPAAPWPACKDALRPVLAEFNALKKCNASLGLTLTPTSTIIIHNCKLLQRQAGRCVSYRGPWAL